MPLKTFIISSLIILSVQLSAYGVQNDYLYTIKGRVVDEYSKPVANASVRIKSPEYDDGCILYIESTDKNGFFNIKREIGKSIFEWTLFVADESLLPENTNTLLNLGDIFSGEYFPSFAGQKITTIENQITDLGDVRLQYRQYPTLIQLLDSEGKALLKERENDDEYGFNPWWIVRDPRGDIIGEGGNAHAHLKLSESAVMNALPEGNWQLDVSDDNGSGFEVSQIINVKPLKDVQKFTLKLKKIASLKFEGRRKTFPYKPKAARLEIEKMGFDFTQDSFEKRVLYGNHKAVALFLNAGMSPNVLTKNNNLLMNALSHPQVLKLLLEAGADTSGKMKDKTTPLLYAAGWSIISISTVKMLLDAGADIEAKDEEGHDALYYSQIGDRPELVSFLKKYLAKKYSGFQD